MRILNLYAGLGGNRKLWTGHEVTAIENNPEIAAEYSKSFPTDSVLVCDAHSFLLNNFMEFDFIWSSYPCQSHSQLTYTTNARKGYRYPDMGLYQEIILLKTFYRGKWVLENVDPYYDPLIRAKKVSRHLFWSNFFIPDICVPFSGSGQFINASSKQLAEWLGLDIGDLFKDDPIRKRQVLRNCVHPILGDHVLKSSLVDFQGTLFV